MTRENEQAVKELYNQGLNPEDIANELDLDEREVILTVLLNTSINGWRNKNDKGKQASSKTGEKQMNPLSKLIREMYPKTHVTPISVMWSIRQTVMGDHVPMQNPPFTNDKP